MSCRHQSVWRGRVSKQVLPMEATACGADTQLLKKARTGHWLREVVAVPIGRILRRLPRLFRYLDPLMYHQGMAIHCFKRKVRLISHYSPHDRSWREPARTGASDESSSSIPLHLPCITSSPVPPAIYAIFLGLLSTRAYLKLSMPTRGPPGLSYHF